MKNLYIYEPALCCATGLCGVSIDPELLRITTVLNTLKERGVAVRRFNLNDAPMEFVKCNAHIVLTDTLMQGPAPYHALRTFPGFSVP